jgi:hypothetical protein
MMNRIVSCAAALLCIGLAQAAPPKRNLSVEVRVVEELADAQRDAQGAVRIDSRGGRVHSDGAVVVQAGSAHRALDATQRVLVLNGGRATLRLGQGVRVDDTEVWWTPWGPGATLRSQWAELVDGIEVRPLWPGDNVPVTLEIAVQRSAPAVQTPLPPGARAALPAQWQVATTVQAPLGEWVGVAQVMGRQAAGASGGFGAATSTRQRSLQVRVSLP